MTPDEVIDALDAVEDPVEYEHGQAAQLQIINHIHDLQRELKRMRTLLRMGEDDS